MAHPHKEQAKASSKAKMQAITGQTGHGRTYAGEGRHFRHGGAPCMARGGEPHSDVAEDRRLVRSMVKPSSLKRK